MSLSILDTLQIIAMISITIARAVINANIYNRLHETDQKMMVSTDDQSIGTNDSAESVLFAAYCALILIWIRFKKADLKWVLINYIMIGMTGLILYNLLR
ncbi:MAG: hypothetical protein AAGF85_02345 [Bacteroidota bacterium]